MASHISMISLFLLVGFPLLPFTVSTQLLLEEGYTVTTIIDGHKLKMNPYSVLPQSGSSDFILLDSSASSFYTLSFPSTSDGGVVVKLLSGKGDSGYQDGELGSARFNQPRSFSLDLKGNIYVADKKNHVIRKITNSGVSTIAGGYSRKEGSVDGPAQNATFSNDFELTFVPQMCALLVSDHGNQLVRQINLKPDDCKTTSKSGLGTASFWALGMGLSCLLGIFIGIVVQSYVIPREAHRLHSYNETWRHYRISLVKQVLTLCFATENAVASSTAFALCKKFFFLCLSHIFLMFRINYLGSMTFNKTVVSLLDSDVLGHAILGHAKIEKQSLFSEEQPKDLLDSSEILKTSGSTDETIYDQGDEHVGNCDVSTNNLGKLDKMIQENIAGFASAEKNAPAVTWFGFS